MQIGFCAQFFVCCCMVLLLQPILVYSAWCNQHSENSNLQGEVVALDYKLYNSDAHIYSAQDCCNACNSIPEDCNSWTFCEDPNGCGTGCSKYMQEIANGGQSTFYSTLSGYSSIKLEEVFQCGDKWPYQTCSLKVSDHSTQEITQGSAAQGWRSGDNGWRTRPTWTCSYDVWRIGYAGPEHPKMYECADDSCGPRQSNLQAKLLDLDVDTGKYTVQQLSTPDIRISFTLGGSPLECCQECKDNHSCDAWVFCNNENGCGSRCRETIQEINQANLTGKQYSESLCTAENKFGFRMCSLKQFENGQYSEIKSGVNAKGWVSGIPQKY
eukprot:TRINITY_DN213_c0_g1_i7.p1 TRINITY_DN213_c0_g1~~TRINITY_DN213_c0_g1_i7.p1  ORF type:complete len:326 (-),score=20.71 TRINITY_DN213_c0_g1_i7:276-1253(-)